MAVARQVVRGLPTPERQRQALPFLIRLAQGDRDEAWLFQATANLLRAPGADRNDLPELVSRFLLAWNSDSLVVEPGLHPGVRRAHMGAGIAGLRPEQLAPHDAHSGGCDAPTTQPDPARLVRRAGNAH